MGCSLILLAALVATIPALAQYRPYGSTYPQPRPYSSHPQPTPVKPSYERFPQPERRRLVIIHQNNQPKLCSSYAGVIRCP
jgi:hypothetical protein